MLKRALIPAAAATLVLALSGCGEDDAGGSGGSEEAASDGSTFSPEFPLTTRDSGPKCSYPTDPAGAAKEVEAPPAHAAVTGKASANIETSAGNIEITLDADKAPCTVNSFVSLAQQGYFADTSCHRLTTSGIYVLQCGDPSGTGSGGPGYSFADELNGKEHYGKGVLAMANAGPDTNGSQFFLVYDDSSVLDSQPNYTIFGSISPEGVETIAEVAKGGTDDANGPGDGHPNSAVDISTVDFGVESE